MADSRRDHRSSNCGAVLGYPRQDPVGRPQFSIVSYFSVAYPQNIHQDGCTICLICEGINLFLCSIRWFTYLQLVLATGVNCFSSRVYGEFEFWFSTIKVVTILLISKWYMKRLLRYLTTHTMHLVLVCLVLDLGAGHDGYGMSWTIVISYT